MADYILEVKNLCKFFGAVEASRDLSFAVQRGHLHALIGPNGAGKTTVLNLLSGELQADSGTILLNTKKINCCPFIKEPAPGLAGRFRLPRFLKT
ncbi:MAG: ATP-binding cassette domain-containing protein [Desulfofustis sp.]